MSTQQILLAIGFDIGTENSEGAVCNGSATPRPLMFPGNGELLDSVVYIDGEETAVGKAAHTKAVKNPHGFYAHFKRLMPDAPHEPCAGPGTPSAARCTTELMRYFWEVALKTTNVADFVPELGGSKPPEQLQIVFTAPASASISYHQVLHESAKQIGIPLHGVIPESVAAAQTFRAAMQGVVKDGHKLLVCDLGGGTFDMSYMKFRDGLFDQLATYGDDNHGALNYQRAVYRYFCEQVGCDLTDAFDSVTGLSSCHEGRNAEQVRLIRELAEKATESIKLLCVAEEAEMYVNTPQGISEVTIDRQMFEQIIAQDGLYQRFSDAVVKMLETANATPGDVDHVVFVGGPAPTWGLRGRLADVMQRPETDIFLPNDSSHAVARGAAMTAMMQEDTSAVLPRGLGFVVLDKRDAANRRNKLVIPTGTSLPPEGITIAEMGQKVSARGGLATIRLTLFEAKPGVDASNRNGKAVLLKDSEIVVTRRLKETVVLPAGEHEVRVDFQISPSNRLIGRLAFPSLQDVDVVTFDVTAGAEGEEEPETAFATDCLLMLDSSSSIGNQMERIKTATYDLLEHLGPTETRVALGRFNSDARILAPFGSSLQEIANQTAQLVSSGSTAMTAMFINATDLFDTQGKEDRKRLSILLTDGQPNEPDDAQAAASVLKDRSKLVCIGVGAGVSDEYLQALATSPSDYFHIDSAIDLPNLFDDLLDLYFDN